MVPNNKIIAGLILLIVVVLAGQIDHNALLPLKLKYHSKKQNNFFYYGV
jgi:hypothetical protein